RSRGGPGEALSRRGDEPQQRQAGRLWLDVHRQVHHHLLRGCAGRRAGSLPGDGLRGYTPGRGKREEEEAMTAKRTARKVAFTPQQRAEHRRIRELFQDWHPSPEELIASGEGRNFTLFGEYPY